MKTAFLFGAGAEVDYGLPTGGRFALEIFRQDSTKSKQDFKENRSKIDTSTLYAGKWLPESFLAKSVSSFGKPVFESIIRDTIEHNRDKIIANLNCFDKIAITEENELNKRHSVNITSLLEERMGTSLSNCNLKQQISFNEYFKEGNEIFSSKYLSALLKIYKKKSISGELLLELRKIILSILQLHIGALSESLTKKINDGIFLIKDDDIDLLDDIGDIMQLNYQATGLTGLEYVMEIRTNEKIQNNDEYIVLFAKKIIENIYATVLDYKTLIDSYWHYLYCPKEEWAKFCKISIFLYTVREYIKNQLSEQTLSTNKGYYHDLKKYLDFEKIEVTTLATTNYNTFIESILDNPISYLNGSTELWYDPYLNKVGDRSQLDKNEVHFTVPLLFTQSGTKPMTCIEMSKLYVKMYDEFQLSDKIVVVGFGFNKDDEHINGILRALIDDEDKHIYVIECNKENTSDKIANKLKTNKTGNVHVFHIDEHRNIDGLIWIEKIIA